MNLITLIEKVITEDGSYTTLKERVGLLRDQISALGKKNSALKSDNVILKSNRNAIESQLGKATKGIERLNQLIQELETDDAKTYLDAATEKVLKMFVRRRRELSVNEVAAAFSIDVSTARYHLDLLLENNLIEQTRIGFVSLQGRKRDPQYSLTSSGREYVFRNIRR
jgi:DNA-binding transcriptional ArsR family regulator